MTYMIAAQASVTVVEKGKRKTIPAGSGYDFSEDDINSINAASPGALRKPLNETKKAEEPEVGADGEGSVNEAETLSANANGSKTVGGKAKRTTANNRKAKVATPEPDDDADEGDDAEDEDI